MKELRETVGCCGLICGVCPGVGSCDCKTAPKPEEADCHQRNCCIAKGIDGCWECEEFPCEQGYFGPGNHGWRGLCVASVAYARDHGLDALVELVARRHGGKMNHGPYMHKTPQEALHILQETGTARQEPGDAWWLRDEGPLPPDVMPPLAEPLEASQLAPGWRAGEGEWSVDGGGRLLGRSGQSAYLYRVDEHADDVRVTATMQAVRGVEITVWICGSPERVEMDGYTLAVSAERAKLQRRGEDVLSDASVTIRPGQDHVLTFERRGATLRGYLNRAGEPFIEWTDPDPLRGEGHRTLGFYIWDGTIAVSNIQVEELSD